ncbi:MAG: hypothetical protein ACXWPM_02350 [Bdellovibrionota bacterium]
MKRLKFPVAVIGLVAAAVGLSNCDVHVGVGGVSLPDSGEAGTPSSLTGNTSGGGGAPSDLGVSDIGASGSSGDGFNVSRDSGVATSGDGGSSTDGGSGDKTITQFTVCAKAFEKNSEIAGPGTLNVQAFAKANFCQKVDGSDPITLLINDYACVTFPVSSCDPSTPAFNINDSTTPLVMAAATLDMGSLHFSGPQIISHKILNSTTLVAYVEFHSDKGCNMPQEIFAYLLKSSMKSLFRRHSEPSGRGMSLNVIKKSPSSSSAPIIETTKSAGRAS